MKTKNTAAESGNLWQTTNVNNLMRHKISGRYYARVHGGGKQIWKALKTSHLSVAKARLADFLKEHRERQTNLAVDTSAKMTFGDALKIHMKNIEGKAQNKSGTAHYWKQIFKALQKSWPVLAEKEVRRITSTDCDEWSKGFGKTASPSRFNNTLAGLRHVLDVAIKNGVIYSNPAAKLKRMKLRAKHLTLPSRDEFLRLVESVATAGAWCSRDCADFIQGLAFTGCRKTEAAGTAKKVAGAIVRTGGIEWRDLNFSVDEIVVRGDPLTGTKNWTVRRIPMIPAAKALFERMRAGRKDEPQTEKVFRVRECQKAIDHACKKLGITRITHHDFRHLFATICIESGVDIPTVSRWLGHKDGGALAMKTYGHLRREYSTAQAQKVSFTNALNAPTNAPLKHSKEF